MSERGRRRAGGGLAVRWDSLRLFTPTRYDSLPGRGFPGDPDSYPGRDEVADSLADYAAHFELPVQVRTAAYERYGEGMTATPSSSTTEPTSRPGGGGHRSCQVPIVPEIASGLDDRVVHLHSSEYRAPGQMPTGVVPVVGGGGPGCQIAQELSGSHEVHLSVGSRQTPLPQRVLGRDLLRILEATGVMTKTRDSPSVTRPAARPPRTGRPRRSRSP